MNQIPRTLLFSIIFSIGLLIFGLTACSENDRDPNSPTTVEKAKVDSNGERDESVGHDHEDGEA